MLSVGVIVHIFNNCIQNHVAVAPITQDTLSTLKKWYPELTKAYLTPAFETLVETF